MTGGLLEDPKLVTTTFVILGKGWGAQPSALDGPTVRMPATAHGIAMTVEVLNDQRNSGGGPAVGPIQNVCGPA